MEKKRLKFIKINYQEIDGTVVKGKGKRRGSTMFKNLIVNTAI